jgi:hypothetical protein
MNGNGAAAVDRGEFSFNPPGNSVENSMSSGSPGSSPDGVLRVPLLGVDAREAIYLTDDMVRSAKSVVHFLGAKLSGNKLVCSIDALEYLNKRITKLELSYKDDFKFFLSQETILASYRNGEGNSKTTAEQIADFEKQHEGTKQDLRVLESKIASSNQERDLITASSNVMIEQIEAQIVNMNRVCDYIEWRSPNIAPSENCLPCLSKSDSSGTAPTTESPITQDTALQILRELYHFLNENKEFEEKMYSFILGVILKEIDGLRETQEEVSMKLQQIAESPHDLVQDEQDRLTRTFEEISYKSTRLKLKQTEIRDNIKTNDHMIGINKSYLNSVILFIEQPTTYNPVKNSCCGGSKTKRVRRLQSKSKRVRRLQSKSKRVRRRNKSRRN